MTRQIPKLFNSAMVAALLAGTKTETRRDLKPQPDTWENGAGETCEIYPFYIDGQSRSRIAMGFNGTGVITEQKCSAEVGDLLWVKEAHYAYGYWRTIPNVFTKKTGKPKREFVRYPAEAVLFEAPANLIKGKPEREVGWYYRVSIHMPKADSRLTLRVTSYGIERLQDIDETGAIAEGIATVIEDTPSTTWFSGLHQDTNLVDLDGWHCNDAPAAYADLWDHINGEGAWDANPWVSVTKFEVIKRNVLEVVT